jgi:hypothetical protein
MQIDLFVDDIYYIIERMLGVLRDASTFALMARYSHINPGENQIKIKDLSPPFY